MESKEIVYLTGLPRSGSTLLSNILAMHPLIYSTPSSPLCGMIEVMRQKWSDEPFLLAQLDHDFETVHERLKRSTMAFMQAWCSDTKHPIVVDKNRGWIYCVETLRALQPNFKMIVTVRDLCDIYKSIEKRHMQTLFIDFPDHMEHNLVGDRAEQLFADNGLVGSALKGMLNLPDVAQINEHIYVWRYEDFLTNPQEQTAALFNFLGIEPAEIDFNNLVQSTVESDSYYRMKYSHRIFNGVKVPDPYEASPRILQEIRTRFLWFYEKCYPELISQAQDGEAAVSDNLSEQDKELVEHLAAHVAEEAELRGPNEAPQ